MKNVAIASFCPGTRGHDRSGRCQVEGSPQAEGASVLRDRDERAARLLVRDPDHCRRDHLEQQRRGGHQRGWIPGRGSVGSEEGGEVVFELTVDGSSCRDIGISLWDRPDICDLDWFLLGSCDETSGDCIEYEDYSYAIDCIEPGTYYLVVDGYEGDDREFVISVYNNEPVPECSPLLSICHMWNFNVSDQGFVHDACGVSNSVWEWAAAFDLPDTGCGGTPVVNVRHHKSFGLVSLGCRRRGLRGARSCGRGLRVPGAVSLLRD